MNPNIGNKIVSFDEDARSKLYEGAEILYKAVSSTLGPRGHTVIIEPELITKDGVTVSKHIKLRDHEKNLGARLLRNVAEKAAEHTGDGTTTATVLGFNFIKQGNKVENVNDFRSGLNDAVKMVTAKLKELSEPVPFEDKEKLKQVATISANGDELVADKVVEAISAVGADGNVSIEEGKTVNTEVVFTKGIKFDKGYLSQYFITDPEKMCAEYEDAYILVSEKRIGVMDQIVNVLSHAHSEGKALIIVADDFDNGVLSDLVLNRVKAHIKVLAIKAPYHAARRKDALEDIATLTGAVILSDDLGVDMNNITPEYLGKVAYVKCSKDDSIIRGYDNDSEVNKGVEDRVAKLKAMLDNPTESMTEYDKTKLASRIAYMTNGMAVIKVGGTTEIEVKELKDRMDDALCATRASIEEGIVPGGGTALMKIALNAENYKIIPPAYKSQSYYKGFNAVIEVIQSPARLISENAGNKNFEDFQNPDFWHGFDASRLQFCNLKEAGVVDPAKVTRCALEDAASIAGLILTTNAIITFDPKDEEVYKDM